MEDRNIDQAFFVWVNKEKRIVTFRETESYERLAFQSQDEKIIYVFCLCEAGYRIL